MDNQQPRPKGKVQRLSASQAIGEDCGGASHRDGDIVCTSNESQRCGLSAGSVLQTLLNILVDLMEDKDGNIIDMIEVTDEASV